MSYKALYRTYRPMTFEEVAGQKHIIQTLKNALKENKIAHAYLFCGPRGTGKTTMARIFAKALNCETEFGHPCNDCENCKAIIEGRHPDVIEIDAASNRGIDDIRDLISKVKYSPILGKYKVYIIDEVHMMTNEAFNALLKTLEEPPEQVIFILATTEPYKLMPTILSRCQRYDFTKVSDGDIYNRLYDVLQNEKIEFENEALTSLVTLADGGMRDALSMLDQVISYCGNSITLKAVQELYGLSSLQEKISLLNYALNKDFLNLTSLLHSFVENGIDIKRLTNELLDILKDLLIYNTTKDCSLFKVLKEIDLEVLSLETKTINAWIDLLLQANSQYRLVNNISSLFEITLIKLASYSEVEIQEVKIIERTIESNPSPVINNPTPIISTPTIDQPIVEEKKIDVVPQTFTNVNFASVNAFVEDGNAITYTIDDIINIMVQASKENKTRLNENIGLLDKLASHNRVGKYASTLKMANASVVCKNAVIFVSDFQSTATKINLKENQYGFSKIVEALYSENCIVICLQRQEFIDATKKFMNLQQANKLPTPIEINIDVKIEKNTNKTETALFAEELMKGEN